MHTNDKNVETVEIKLQGDLNNAKHWSEDNKLPLNYNKTTCMTIGTNAPFSIMFSKAFKT